MRSEFITAINMVSSEKGVPKDVVIRALEAALVSAYKRNFNTPLNQVVTVTVHPQTGDVKVFAQKQVVDVVSDPHMEIAEQEARGLSPDAHVGVMIEVDTTPSNFGRIAAQTAKQVVLQRLREAERDMVFDAFAEREGDILTGTIQRLEAKAAIIDLGKAEAVMPATEQVPNERYRPGQRLKFFVAEVVRNNKGPQIVLSRTHKGLLRRLFELEVPEIFNGTVEIKSIAREPGSRSKVAVAARQEGIDPVGSCVGQRGVRIQNIVNELNGEKIDVVQWNIDSSVFVANALSPAQVISVEINEAEKTATVVVPERQLSLAIGKEGQNARLAARLTGWRIDIKPAAGVGGARPVEEVRGTSGSSASQIDVPAAPEPAVVERDRAEVANANDAPALLSVDDGVGEVDPG